MKRFSFLVLALLVVSSSVYARTSYYPDNYQAGLTKMSGEELKQAVFELLTKMHIQKNGRNDVLVNDCSEGPSGTCYGHRSLGYRGARKVLFGKLHLQEDGKGYYIRDVYCRQRFQDGVGPNQIPNHAQVNCEHTWPQSRFNKRFPNETQKSDLHHLYPTESRANSVRGNHEFRNVDAGYAHDGCRPSHSDGSNFEPPTEHKGNVARALFYFSVRYKIQISPAEEEVLRQWHELDPVDAEEIDRNDWIQKIQGNRNPFVDYPEMVDSIADF